MSKRLGLPFREMNNWTYQFNQAYFDGVTKEWRLRGEDRDELVKMKTSLTEMTNTEALASSSASCYEITEIFDVWFKGIETDDTGMEDIFKFLYDHKCVNPYTSFQMKGALDTYNLMKDNGLLRPFTFQDVDFRYSGETRKSVYDQLMDYMGSEDFTCARVCFCSDPLHIDTKNEAAHDHALMVAIDEQGRKVVMDTSYRPHEASGNSLEGHINTRNIRWWTAIDAK